MRYRKARTYRNESLKVKLTEVKGKGVEAWEVTITSFKVKALLEDPSCVDVDELMKEINALNAEGAKLTTVINGV